MSDRAQRRDELKAVWAQARTCTRCPQLAETRHTVVFGAGDADADLMFVGEAPGANEDRRGLPFVGQAGGLLDTLLEEIGLRRADVFIANVLKCRPPGNRDPLPQEIDNCQEYLFRQLELIRPRLVCTLGNFATKLLRGDPATGITRLHGRPEERVLGPLAVRLYPLLHPAAALYTPRMVETLRADFQRIPELLSLPPLEQPPPVAAPPAIVDPGLVADPPAPVAATAAGKGGAAPSRSAGTPAPAPVTPRAAACPPAAGAAATATPALADALNTSSAGGESDGEDVALPASEEDPSAASAEREPAQLGLF